jgi:hypothetical protein
VAKLGKSGVIPQRPHISSWRVNGYLYIKTKTFFTDFFEYPFFINPPKTKQFLRSTKLFLDGAKSAGVYCNCFTIFGRSSNNHTARPITWILIAKHCNKTCFPRSNLYKSSIFRINGLGMLYLCGGGETYIMGLEGKFSGNKSLEKAKPTWEGNIKMDVKEVSLEGVQWRTEDSGQ